MPDYILTNIPEAFHQSWKMYAAALGMTMKDFCFAALAEKILQVKGELNNGGEHSKPDGRRDP